MAKNSVPRTSGALGFLLFGLFLFALPAADPGRSQAPGEQERESAEPAINGAHRTRLTAFGEPSDTTPSISSSASIRSARLDPPRGLDAYVPVPDENPATAAKVALGRRLFFDTRLSADRSVSCASCHRPEQAFSDTLSLSRGVHGYRTTRNAPSLHNVAYREHFFWDGRVETLEEQVLRPIQHPREMGLTLEEMERRLREVQAYRREFRRVFGVAGRGGSKVDRSGMRPGPFPADRSGARTASASARRASAPSPVTARNVARALASYLRTLLAGDAPVDRFTAGDREDLSPVAEEGFRLFSGRANCSACHPVPTFSDGEFHNTGVSWGERDPGRFGVTGDSADLGAFKTPTLRDVARTAPYMHDGSLSTLEDVVEFYDRGGNANPYQDGEIRPLELTSRERRALVAFLEALTSSQTPASPARQRASLDRHHR